MPNEQTQYEQLTLVEKAVTRAEHDKNYQIIKQQNYQVVKANALIQKTKFTLNAKEIKVFNFLVSKIKPGEVKNNEITFTVKEYCEICGINSSAGKNHQDIKKAILKLAAPSSGWIELEDGRQTVLRFIEKPYFDSKTSKFTIRFDKDILPYLYHIGDFHTKHTLMYSSAMESQYSIRLYELLKSYLNLGEKTFKLEELRDRIGVTKYNKYFDFKKNVLELAAREIKEFSDIEMAFHPIKTGRAVTHVLFLMESKSQEGLYSTWDSLDKKLHINNK